MKIKFNRLLVSIIGFVLLIGLACILWFCLIKPANETLSSKNAEYEPLAQYNETLLQSTIQNREVQFRKADMAEKLYDTYMSRFMPMLDFGRRDTGMIDYWREYTNIKKVLENFGNDPNVTTHISLNVPNPPTNPNDSLFDSKVITYTGSVTVTGDYSSILDNMVRWSSAPRLVLVNANNITMTMQGDDPNKVTANYGITCYVIPWTSGGAKIEMATNNGGASPNSGSGMRSSGMPGAMPPGAGTSVSPIPGASATPGAMPPGVQSGPAAQATRR